MVSPSASWPFQEEGWFVKKKKSDHDAIVESVGKDAERARAKVVKKALKSVKRSGK